MIKTASGLPKKKWPDTYRNSGTGDVDAGAASFDVPDFLFIFAP